jgi:aspartyl-tRNA(Asn)/glutamyl-tRNA(Gln) amidotransferase subunit A
LLEYSDHSDKISKILSGTLSLAENYKAFLARIEEESKINAFNSVFTDLNDRIAEIGSGITKGGTGKLAGMTIAVKDLLALKDKPLTCSSKMLDNFISTYTATSVQNLLDEDAVIIGKTNCDEFGMGSSNENSFYGNVLNPYDNSRVPGGSSGGSAAAVAAGLCDAAIGTDTGGSIRQPASFCGLFGLKPTYGLVSRYGLTAYASSFDTVGPLTRNTYDCALILEVISGTDRLDSTSAAVRSPSYSKELDLKDVFRIGIPKEYFSEGLNKEIRDQISRVIERLRADGFEITEISLPLTEYAVSTYYILAMAEASSNLERYDGMRYGYRSEAKGGLEEKYINSRSEGFGTEVKRRIMLGTYILSAGYYDAYYKKAQQVRALIRDDFSREFDKVDVILTPVTPTTAFELNEKAKDPLSMYLSDIYTTSANLAGIPAMSIPIGFDSRGLPIGLQIMADHFEELKLLRLSGYLEKNL